MPPGSYNTDLGFALRNLEDGYLRLIDNSATLMILGDGRNNNRDPEIAIFERLSRRARHTIWINPDLEHMWGEGDSDMLKYMKLCELVFHVENLNDLGKAVTRILTL